MDVSYSVLVNISFCHQAFLQSYMKLLLLLLSLNGSLLIEYLLTLSAISKPVININPTYHNLLPRSWNQNGKSEYVDYLVCLESLYREGLSPSENPWQLEDDRSPDEIVFGKNKIPSFFLYHYINIIGFFIATGNQYLHYDDANGIKVLSVCPSYHSLTWRS